MFIVCRYSSILFSCTFGEKRGIFFLIPYLPFTTPSFPLPPFRRIFPAIFSLEMQALNSRNFWRWSCKSSCRFICILKLHEYFLNEELRLMWNNIDLDSFTAYHGFSTRMLGGGESITDKRLDSWCGQAQTLIPYVFLLVISEVPPLNGNNEI